MINEPIFFERNRVGRVYLGGKLFADFFGDEPIDGFKPEEWIASNVKAMNKIQESPKEGISKIKGFDIYFDELLNKYPEEMLGSKKNFRILVKALDSAIRLPAQAHPDKAFSKKYFKSGFGKTECWVILDTRPDAKIFLNFKDNITKELFEQAIEKSEYDKNAMEELMLDITPKVGDVYLVPARTIHAIGKGCLILEIQEPTDFTIQPERLCGDYKLSDYEMYLGIPKEDAVTCFDFENKPEAQIVSTTVTDINGLKIESLINESHTDCFIINRITLSDSEYIPNIIDSYAIYVVIDGSIEISNNEYRKTVKKGDYFFMPASQMSNYKFSGNASIIECY
ncbi:MAG: class I mannose-6-phosphate isomerase [Clostridia bacterium]|nr:class I mannose-6-phosphate isomerase [Clostridia bacterium]MBO5911929.1 class I mannose-6-phosphate isomerase [Clostridia bacterium]